MPARSRLSLETARLCSALSQLMLEDAVFSKRYLLEGEYPGAHIGPEPTTDRFMCVMHGAQERRTPGNALAVSADKPFRGLSQFGTGFLSKLECKSFTGSVPPFPCYARCNCVLEPSAGEEGPDTEGNEQGRGRGRGTVGCSTVQYPCAVCFWDSWRKCLFSRFFFFR